MSFEQPNENLKSEKIEIKAKDNGLAEKAKSIARKAVVAGTLAAGAVGLGYEAKEKYLTDYSNLPTKEEALIQAESEKKTGFIYKGKYYEVEKLEKKFNQK